MNARAIGIIVIVLVVGLAVGAGATYVMNQSRIENMETDYKQQINNLQSEKQELITSIENSKEFNRLIFKGLDEVNTAFLNDGCERAYEEEANTNYDIGYFNWAELYYSNALNYCSYAGDSFDTASIYLNQAITYTDDAKTLEYLNKYIDMLDAAKSTRVAAHNYLDDLRLACYYYNISDYDKGDEKIESSNSKLSQYNTILGTQNNLITQLEIMLETSWRD